MEKVSTIIRFHDYDELHSLIKALESLHAQDSIAVRPIVVCQNMSSQQLKKIEAESNDVWYFAQHEKPIILKVNEIDTKKDLRSKLINVGIEEHIRSGNRFLTFLDYDDVLYSHAFKLLSTPLLNTPAVVSFASVELASASVIDEYDFVYAMSNPYRGSNKLDLLRDNFCPIHSYMIDTSKSCLNNLYFNEKMTRVEDYEFLLRFAGDKPCNFTNLGKFVGIYYMRDNGKNTTPNESHGENLEFKKQEWKSNISMLDSAKAGIEVKLYASDF